MTQKCQGKIEGQILSKNTQMNKEQIAEFLNIVETFGGENCKCWTKVARMLQQRTGLIEMRTQQLKKKWEKYVKYDENFNDNQIQILFETLIQNRGNRTQALEDFKIKTGCKISLGRYSCKMGSFLTTSVKNISLSYMAKKKRIRIPYTSILCMLKSLNIKNCQCLLFNEFKIYAQILEDLLLIHSKCWKQELSDRFHEYNKIVTRQQFKRVIFYLEFCNELTKMELNIDRIDLDGIIPHPLILKTKIENQNTQFYQLLIPQSDWKQKYKLLQECQIQDEKNQEYCMLIKQKNKKNIINNDFENNYDLISQSVHKFYNKGKHSFQEKSQTKFNKFRGRYYQQGQMKTIGMTTIQFEHDFPSDISDIDINTNEKSDIDEKDIETLRKVYYKLYK